ncbi:MAG TPA: hypothetical protein VGF99_03510 [Myxococcota bacterium]
MSARWCVLALVVLAGCGGANDGLDRLHFFDVQRARTEECTIRSNGEFCVEPEQFDPPVSQVWSIDRRSADTLLVVDEEVWVLDAQPDGADPYRDPWTASRYAEISDGGTGCVTTRTTELEFAFDDDVIAGTVAFRSVVEGPAACGDTPAGERTLDSISGSSSGP